MTIRRHHRDTLPPAIADGPVAEERVRILRILAERPPEIAQRTRVRIIAKGGAMLGRCEGTPRPSTDYDCDTDKRWSDAAQARAVQQALRDAPSLSDLTVTEPTTRTEPAPVLLKTGVGGVPGG